MTELFRSALSYLSQTAPIGTPVIGKLDHPLIGTNVEIGSLKLRIRSLIAEGGYALVFAAQDVHGNWFALKRQLATDRQAAEAILKEIRFLKELTGHPAILHYVKAAQLSPQESGHGHAEFLLLTELCPGSVIELIQKGPLTVKQVLKIFHAACSAIKHMHARKPPVTHRDMKIENLLFDVTGHVKLCDFGSATAEIVMPDDSWSVLQRTRLEEELARYTTPMYRAPELLDMYSNFPVGPAQDIWALGCVLYYLCYRKHPFEDSAKLRIINAKYSLPTVGTTYTVLHPLIQATLKVDPRKRPQVVDLCGRVEMLASSLSVDLTEPVENLDLPQLSPGGSSTQSQTNFSVNESERLSAVKRSPLVVRKNDHDQTAQQASAVFGAIKGHGMSWFRNIKDKTVAVAQTVQSTYGNRGPDITFVTSRLVIAPFADSLPESLALQAEEAMRTHLINQSRGQFAIFNLSASRHLRCDYGSRLNETPLPAFGSGLTPTVKFLLNLCRNMVIFLMQKETKYIVLTGPEAQCMLMAAALLVYTRLAPRPLSALELICSKRQPSNLPPSYHRQLDVIATVISTEISQLREMVHNRPVVLQSLLISPVPLFNRARTGCRPFVEIHAGGTKLWSTYKNYDELKLFEVTESHLVELPLGDIPVGDDVQIVVYHARWAKMHGRMQRHLMFSIIFHANFIDPNTHILEFNRGDLDHLPEDDSKFGEQLRCDLQMMIGEHDRGFSTREPPAILSYNATDISRSLLVSESEELDAIMQHLGLHNQKQSVSMSRKYSQKNRFSGEDKKEGVREMDECTSQTVQPRYDSFFSTLQWQDSQLDNSSVNISTKIVDDDSHQVTDSQPLQQHSLQASSLEGHSPQQGNLACDPAELSERICDIRVSAVKERISDDQDKVSRTQQPQLSEEDAAMADTSVTEADLLGLESEFSIVSCSSGCTRPVIDVNSGGAILSENVFTHAMLDPSVSSSPFEVFNEDEILMDFGVIDTSKMGMQRNVSVSVFPDTDTVASTSETKFDPFTEFLANTSDTSAPPSKSIKAKNLENAFDDLLTSQGFQSSAKTVKSLCELRQQEESIDMDPVAIKVRNWTRGKERNIRALLGSLNDILWPTADKWIQPSIGDLLTAQQVKKYYRKACLVVHPDKQVGTEFEALARAVFTELNDGWTAFENAGLPSI